MHNNLKVFTFKESYIDQSVPCFAEGQRNDFEESTEYSSEYNLYC